WRHKCMKLNHINLTVTDVQEARKFLETYFGLREIESGRENPNFAALFDDDQLVLTLLTAARGAEVHYPGTFHIGFFQESEERVNEINQHWKNDGLDVGPPERSHAWSFYVQAPGGFTVEVGA